MAAVSGGAAERLLPGRIPPDEMFPAGDERFHVRWLRTRAGDRVRVVESGPAGGDAVVLIPGWGCPAYVFRWLLPALAARGYRAMTPELRGHGLSDKPHASSAYGTAAMVEHVVEVVDALELDTLALGGHSLGAALAARAAPRLHGRLRALLLLSPVGTHGQPRKMLTRLLARRLLLPFVPWLARRWVVRLALRMAAARGGLHSSRDIDEYCAASQFRGYGPALLHLLHELDWGDRARVNATDLTVPTLLLYGTRDPLVARTGVVRDLARSPYVRVVALRGAGHIITDEEPRQVEVAVLEFLASAAPVRAV